MTSIFAEYNSEMKNKFTIENEHGFLVYSIDQSIIYFEEIFVRPEFRKTGVGSEMCDFALEIGKSKGCKQLLCSVDVQIKDATNCVRRLIDWGMILYSLRGTVIYFMKDI